MLVINFLLLNSICLSSRDLWLRIKTKCNDMKNDDASNDSQGAHWTSWMFMSSLFGLLFLSMMLSILCVIVGVTVVGAQSTLREFCEGTVASIDDTRLDLSVSGMDKIACGADFVQFCSDFSGGGNIINACWGAIIVAAGEFYLIAYAAVIIYQERSERAALQTCHTGEAIARICVRNRRRRK